MLVRRRAVSCSVPLCSFAVAAWIARRFGLLLLLLASLSNFRHTLNTFKHVLLTLSPSLTSEMLALVVLAVSLASALAQEQCQRYEISDRFEQGLNASTWFLASGKASDVAPAQGGGIVSSMSATNMNQVSLSSRLAARDRSRAGHHVDFVLRSGDQGQDGRNR